MQEFNSSYSQKRKKRKKQYAAHDSTDRVGWWQRVEALCAASHKGVRQMTLMKENNIIEGLTA